MAQEFKERYEYSLDSRQLGVVMLAAGVLAALVFVLGVSVGIQWQKRTQAQGTNSAGVTGEDVMPAGEEPPGNGLPVAPAVEPENSRLESETRSNDEDKEVKEAKKGEGDKPSSELTFTKTLASREPAAAKSKPTPKASPGTSAREKADKPADKAGGIYTVQVGAFKESESAKRLVDRLKKHGYDAEYRRAEGAAGLYKVRVGSFTSLADARGVAAKLETREGLKPYVTSY